MKKFYMVVAAFLGCIAVENVCAQLVINGATLFIESGAVVSVQGNLSSTTDIQGTGKIVMNGTAGQELNMNGNTIPNLEINNTSNVSLTGSTRVSGLLEFTNGRLLAGAHNFTLGPTATFAGAGPGKYIETNGLGEVRKEITAGGTYLLPIGKANAYMPMEYTLSSNTIGGGAYLGGQVVATPHPNRPIRSDDYLSAYWRPTLNNVTGGSVNVTTTYADVNSYVGTESLLNGLRWNGSDWSLTDNSINSSANTVTYNNVTTGNELYAMNKFVYLSGRVFLQGAFNAGTNKMNDALRVGTNLIPLSDPYRSAPYNTFFAHSGNTVVETVDPSVFANQANDDKNIVDWIFLELRDGSNALVQTRSALLQKDGSIVEVDGVNPVYFKNLNEGSYIVTVRHRNHLGLAADASSFSRSLSVARPSAANSFDFATATDAQLFGNSQAYKTTNGLNMLWGGNANGNGNVRYSGANNDNSYLLTTILGGNPALILNNVYSIADLNLNRNVRYSGANNDNSFLLTTVLGGNASTILTQQIPN